MSSNQIRSSKQVQEPFFFRASATDFNNIPGNSIAYWVSDQVRNSFKSGRALKEIGDTRQGMATSDNNRFLRLWTEVSFSKANLDATNRTEALASGKKWFPYNKGGDFRKWYGNSEFFVNWENDGHELIEYASSLYGSPTRTIKSISEYFKPCVSWSKVSSGSLAMRFYPKGFLFDVAGCCIFSPTYTDLMFLLGYSNTTVVKSFLSSISPTLNFEAGQIASLPVLEVERTEFEPIPEKLVIASESDWNSYETSWGFTELPLLSADHRRPALKASYQNLRTHWRKMTLDMQHLEEENNRIFIEAYGLEEELRPEVPIAEITLTCNPHYRYGGDKTEDELEALLLADTMRELVSYAVGCMFGRYSLDKPGLILANQGDTWADYLAQVPQPRFPADDDNVIPMLDGDWFADDITLRVRQFLRVAFGDMHYEDNLAFIEQALNIKGKRNYGLRDYLISEFYTDHLKRYKKRPIYWLFSSPKGSFSALIYMHRYRPDTVSVVLRYLRDYREKLATEKERQVAVSINPASGQGEKTRALKDTDRLAKVLAELEDYERDTLYPLATQQVQVDLDDGVKVNYLKFDGALKKIPGLAAKDEG